MIKLSSKDLLIEFIFVFTIAADICAADSLCYLFGICCPKSYKDETESDKKGSDKMHLIFVAGTMIRKYRRTLHLNIAGGETDPGLIHGQFGLNCESKQAN